jgi:TolA-binding protein
MAGSDPNMGGEQGAEGFNPQGADMNGGLDGMGGDLNQGGALQSDDVVIDVDDLTKSQEEAEKKIDRMNDKFEKLMGAVNTLIKQNAERDAKEKEAQLQMKAELDKRIPTPQQRMSMRSTKSSPYSMTPNEYMNNYAPENYSDADDNNGADDMQYQITKDDIDRFTDYNSIMKDLDVEHQGLKDILGF